MNNLRNLPEVLEVNLWIYDTTHGHNGHRVPELDEDNIDWDKVRFWDEGDDLHGNHFHLVRYTCSDGFNRLCALFCEPELTAEDLAEWQASSAGIDYYRVGR